MGVELLISPMMWEAGSHRLLVDKKEGHQGEVRTLGEDNSCFKGPSASSQDSPGITMTLHSKASDIIAPRSSFRAEHGIIAH